MRCSIALPALAASSLGCDVSYDFGDRATAKATSLSVTLTWWTVEPQPSKPNVYLSTATGTACNSGYFGAQFHSDGTQSLLFSMWDAHKFKANPKYVYQGLPGRNCKRNALDSSGKSTGVQCKPRDKVHIKLGVPYVFEMNMSMTNSSGAQWRVTSTDTATGEATLIGEMFFVDAPMGLPETCRSLGKSQNPPTTGLASYTFLEYFAQPRNFLTNATWSDMVARDASTPGSAEIRPAGIVKECCDHGDWKHGDKVNGSSSTCLPPRCASPAIDFVMGPHLLIPPDVLAHNPGCLGPAPAPPPGPAPPPPSGGGCPAGQFCPLLGGEGGQGGCATAGQSYPPTLRHDNVADREACEAECASAGEACAAYAFCAGSNCKGNCDLYPEADYTRENGYPTVTCYKRGPFDYPPGGSTMRQARLEEMPIF